MKLTSEKLQYIIQEELKDMLEADNDLAKALLARAALQNPDRSRLPGSETHPSKEQASHPLAEPGMGLEADPRKSIDPVRAARAKKAGDMYDKYFTQVPGHEVTQTDDVLKFAAIDALRDLMAKKPSPSPQEVIDTMAQAWESVK